MRVDIYPENEDKILRASSDLGISYTQLVNEIIQNITLVTKIEITKAEMVFKKPGMTVKEKVKITKRDNFIGNWE